MAVNVNTVYQRVLAILNKEQRGYITPQEFNYFANQAQLDIFEQYFYDLNQFLRLPGNDTGHADVTNILEEKISLFKANKGSSDLSVSSNKITLTTNDLYRLTAIYLSDVECDRVTKREARDILLSPLSVPTADRPIFYEEDGGFYIYNGSSLLGAVTNVDIDYIKKPADASWAYNTVSGAAVYNSTNSVNFELHESEETELVIKILQLAGLAIKDPSVYQAGTQMEMQGIQQEKA